MATSNGTLPISLRGGLLPVLRYGNYAGPGYAGGLGSESLITHPDINGGKTHPLPMCHGPHYLNR